MLLLRSVQVQLGPHQTLFRVGDPSDSGIFIVVSGTLGVFLEDGPSCTPVLFNTLRCGAEGASRGWECQIHVSKIVPAARQWCSYC